MGDTHIAWPVCPSDAVTGQPDRELAIVSRDPHPVMHVKADVSRSHEYPMPNIEY